MLSRKQKDEEAPCRDCGDTIRRGGYGDEVWIRKQCPRCYTIEITEKGRAKKVAIEQVETVAHFTSRGETGFLKLNLGGIKYVQDEIDDIAELMDKDDDPLVVDFWGTRILCKDDARELGTWLLNWANDKGENDD